MIRSAVPAHTTVRGFTGTPVTSGDEDSDACPTPLLRGKSPVERGRKLHAIDDLVSANCSPVLKPSGSPAVSGISQLRLQLESLSLNLDSTAASSRASSVSRSESRPSHPSPLTSDTSVSSRRPVSRDTARRHKQSLSATSDDETSSVATTSYEINLENDFASEATGHAAATGIHADAIEGGPISRRKMTADDFEQLRCLGKGTYGTVLLVRQRTTGRLYAQKQFKKASLVVHKRLIEQTKTERQILESVNRHPFVVNLYYAFQDQAKLYLILEYGQGGELFTHLSSERMFPEPTAAFYMAEMLLALAHLHDNLGVVYRDLKPENCLLDAEGHLLLTDFGLSKVAVDPDTCNSFLGTVEYMAPEVIQGKKYGKAVDWWSFGALGFDLMTGNPPFRGQNNAKIQENIVKQKLALPYFLSPDAKDLLTRLLRKDPAKRIGSNMPKDLTAMKNHRFFRRINWKQLAARELEPPIQPLITDPELAENFAPEFTRLSLSPVGNRFDDQWGSPVNQDTKDDPFGGFSFVASSSLLESDGFHLPKGF